MIRLPSSGICLIALALAACSPPGEPEAPALAFRGDGATYAWRAVHGTTESLVLGREGDTGAEPPALALTCRGEALGGARVEVFRAEPVSPPLELTAGSVTLTVPARRVVTERAVALEGDGVLPSGWFEALATTGPLTLRYGDQGLEVQGPGRALAEGFRRRCRELDRPAG